MKSQRLIKITFLSFWLILTSIHTYGQSSQVEKLPKKEIPDNSKAENYFILANRFLKSDPNKAQDFLKMGKQNMGSDPYLNAQALFIESKILSKTNPQKAEINYLQINKLLSPYQTKQALLLRARAWNSYARLQQKKHDDKKVFQILIQKVIPLSKTAGDSIYLAENYEFVGQMLMKQYLHKQASGYYEKALEQLEHTKKNGPLRLSVKISSIQNFLRSKQTLKAKKILDEIRDLIPQNSQLAVRYELNEGIYYNQINQHKIALQKFSDAKKIATELQDTLLKDAVTFYQISTLKKMKNYEEAKKIGGKAFITSHLANYGNHNKIALYMKTAEIYSQQKKYDSAYYFLKKYNYLKDSLMKIKLKSEISGLEVKFRSQENQTKITELKASNQKAEFKVKQSKLYIGLFIITTILLSTIAVLLYLYLRKSKKEYLNKQQISNANALLKGQEEERKRIARDLHDDLGGTLASVKMRLSGYMDENDLNAKNDSLEKIMKQVNESSAKIRQIANNMMPEMLLKLGLEKALKDLCHYYRSSRLNINLNYLEISDKLEEHDKLTIYRIIQELLTNAIKHADAKNILIQCSQDRQIIFITFEDDGKGLYKDRKKYTIGLGLENIKARVAYMNGKIDIISGKGYTGTIFNIELNTSNET